MFSSQNVAISHVSKMEPNSTLNFMICGLLHVFIPSCPSLVVSMDSRSNLAHLKYDVIIF